MRAHGWRGVTRRKKVRTTIADPAAARAADLVKRQFRVAAPNVLLVADLVLTPPPGKPPGKAGWRKANRPFGNNPTCGPVRQVYCRVVRSLSIVRFRG